MPPRGVLIGEGTDPSFSEVAGDVLKQIDDAKSHAVIAANRIDPLPVPAPYRTR
jgi:hypothetical protein